MGLSRRQQSAFVAPVFDPRFSLSSQRRKQERQFADDNPFTRWQNIDSTYNDGSSLVVMEALPLPFKISVGLGRLTNKIMPKGAAGPAFAAAVSPVSAAAFLLTGVVLGYLIGRKRGMHVSFGEKDSRSDNMKQIDFPQEGATPDWFNYALAKLWALLSKNTRQFSQEVIQKILDEEVEMPDFVQDVRLIQYNIGEKSPDIRDLRPVPARSLAEIQCSYTAHLRSTSDLKFEVELCVPDNIVAKNRTITVPVSLSNLQIDAKMWSAFSMAPYPPYCTSCRYSLLETPNVSFDMNVAAALPVTSVPGIRSLFFKIISKEIPKDFMFPLSNTVDFTPEKLRAKKKDFMNMTIDEIERLSDVELEEVFPEQWALYKSLDLNRNGLTKEDLASGLANWGYETADAEKYFDKLDTDGKGCVDFSVFCMMWPNVTSSNIPQEYEGILSLAIGNATNLTNPALGWSDPMVKINLGTETVTSTPLNDDEEAPIFEESFDIKSKPITNQTLEIRVEEDSNLALRGKGRTIAWADVPLHSLEEYPRQNRVVELEPQGSISIDMAYAKFVDS